MKHQNNHKPTIIYRSGDQSLLDDIQVLWEALNQHHRDAAVNFKGHYENTTFEMRKKNLLLKAKSGQMRIEIAVDNEKAFGFYERFGFYPRKIQLEQIK